MLNGAEHLDSAVRSIREQSWTNWSACIRDGGSCDASIEIAKRHASEDSRVSVIVEADSGQYDALYRGLEAVPNGMIAWLNSDDLYLPWAFETIARAYSQDGAKWIAGFPALWDADGRLHAILPTSLNSRWSIRAGWRNDSLLGCLQQETIFFHSDLWKSLARHEKSKFANARLAGDFYLWTRFARRASLITVPTAIGGFRLHANNRSRVSAAEYQREAETLGAFSPPRVVAKLIRNLHDAASAINSILLFRRAALDLERIALQNDAED